MSLYINGIEATSGSSPDGTLVDAVQTINATGIPTAVFLLGNLVKVDTSLGDIDVTFPNFDATHDRKGGTIQNESTGLLRLIAPVGYTFLHAGGVTSPYSMPDQGDSIGFLYVHATAVIHLF